jgi:hypothetical protein
LGPLEKPSSWCHERDGLVNPAGVGIAVSAILTRPIGLFAVVSAVDYINCITIYFVRENSVIGDRVVFVQLWALFDVGPQRSKVS